MKDARDDVRERFFGRDGKPLTFEQWRAAFAQPNGVVRDDVGAHQVSTVWIGVSYGPPGRRFIFETMCFSPDARIDGYRRSYSTEGEAKAGHAAIVALLRRFEAHGTLDDWGVG